MAFNRSRRWRNRIVMGTLRQLRLMGLMALLGLAAACGGDDEQGGNSDAASSIDAAGGSADGAMSIDASGDVADADPSAPDADPSAPDSAPAPDASLVPDGSVGVTCGDTSCDLASQECCVTQMGPNVSTECVDIGMCSDNTVSCDGPEDCDPGDDCCATFGGPGMGGGDTSCTDSCMGFVLCNDSGDCPMDAPNCCSNPLGAGNVCTQFACL